MLATLSRPDQVRCPAQPRRDSLRSAHRRRLGLALAVAGPAMIPWVFYLWLSLPASATDSHWALAWVGLDSCEALTLFATGLFLLRSDNRCALTATAAAALLLIDAWIDVTSATAGSELAVAIVMALGAEIPTAVACIALALRLTRRPFPAGRPDRNRKA
jgi:hypothetical protein